jgi:hypothetical protein
VAAVQRQASLQQLAQAEAAVRRAPAQAQQERAVAWQRQEAAVAEEEQLQLEPRVSLALLGRRLPGLPCPLLLFVPPQLPRPPARENARAPLPLRLLQSSWSASFSQ